MTIKRVGPLSCAKIAGLIYAAIGLLVGAFIGIFTLIGVSLFGPYRGVADNTPSAMLSTMTGVAAIFVCPILYGVIGFVFALIGAWLYNLIASRVGGIEIDIS